MSTLLSIPDDVKSAAFPFLAEAIIRAHAIGPAKWGLTPKTSDGLIRLNMGWTEILTIGPEIVRVFVNREEGEKVTAIRSGTLKMTGQQEELPSSPGFRLVEVPRGPGQDELLASLLAAHVENVRRTALRAGAVGRTIKTAHSESAIEELSEFVGRKLPQPLYRYDQKWEEAEMEMTAEMEGASHDVIVTRRKRSLKNRENALKIHGETCMACGFNFAAIYGEKGVGFIHVHHIEQLAHATGAIPVDPTHDLVVICANCHAMMHRDASRPPLSLAELILITNSHYSDLLRAEFPAPPKRAS
jgi:hypothetical protein